MGDPLFEIPKKSFNLDWLSPVTSIIGNIGNWISQDQTNKANQKINQQNLDYNTKMTQLQWERDDNAHQREVADLEAAGLSPLANTTGSQVTSALGAPNPIAMQAPQIDTNTLINSVLGAQQLGENKRHNLVQEGQKDAELYLQAEENENKAKQIELENKKLEHDIVYQYNQLAHLDKQLAETQRSNKESEKLKKMEYLSEQYYKETQEQTKGKFKEDPCYNINEYEAKMKIWQSEFDAFVASLDKTSYSESFSESQSAGGGVDAKVLGSGAGFDLSTADSSSSAYSQNISQKQQAEYDKWIATHPMPVFHYYHKQKE